MALTKGFSLIETLMAITIASIATMALMRVVSYASLTSSNALKHFDSSILMSLAIESVDESRIREMLKSTSYDIILLPKENITPFMNDISPTSSLNSLSVQKVILKSSQENKSFFRITTNNL